MNILVFCSNPVNGGTARVFYELVITMRKMLSYEDRVIACVNECNEVEIYRKIEEIQRIPVYSEEEICSGMYGGTIVKRVINRFLRKLKYKEIKRHNIFIMRKYLREMKIDAVVIHNGGYVGDDLCNQMLSAAYQCAEHTLCRIYVLHNDMKKNICSMIRFLRYDRKISKEATDIVTVSQFTKNRISKSSFISREIRLIYNGISDVHNLTDEEKKKIMYVDSSKVNILMIGNFLDNKGQREFLEAVKIITKKDLKCHFSIIGNVYDKDYYIKCQDLIKKYNLTSSISIYQGIHNASEFIDLFDMLVVPSIYDESFGLISVEAMANRRPVVAFACGGIPEVVLDGQDGFIVPVRDINLLAEKIEWLIKHPDVRKSMGEQCRKDYMERFTVDVMANEYLELISLQIKSQAKFKEH